LIENLSIFESFEINRDAPILMRTERPTIYVMSRERIRCWMIIAELQKEIMDLKKELETREILLRKLKRG